MYKGITLLETLIVLFILGLTLTFTLPAFRAARIAIFNIGFIFPPDFKEQINRPPIIREF